jgi:hypothetical protein
MPNKFQEIFDPENPPGAVWDSFVESEIEKIKNTGILPGYVKPEILSAMKFFEGSIAELGSEDWSEPCDVQTGSAQIAAGKVVEWFLECGEVEANKEVAICIREISIEGSPLSEWVYFRGSARASYRSTIKEL